MLTKDAVPMHTPVIITDGGPWVLHDMPCAVCQSAKAIFHLQTGTFHPCNGCYNNGWDLRQKKPSWWNKLLNKIESWF